MKLKTIKYLIQSILAGIGILWMFVEAYNNLQTANASVTFSVLVLSGGILGVVWFLIDGYFIEGFLNRKIQIKSNAIDVQIDVLFGDIFKHKGCIVIGVNDYFDSAIDGMHVSENSLHGKMLKKYWPKNIADWDSQILNELDSITPAEKQLERIHPGKKDRYEIGTTAKVKSGNTTFLCVSLARTNSQTLQASANSDDLLKALKGMLFKARGICSGNTLNIPLLGSGLSKTGIKFNILIDLILLSIFEESKKEKITGHIRIVLPKELKNQIDLMNINEDWR